LQVELAKKNQFDFHRQTDSGILSPPILKEPTVKIVLSIMFFNSDYWLEAHLASHKLIPIIRWRLFSIFFQKTEEQYHENLQIPLVRT
jgi:hypothetical protein